MAQLSIVLIAYTVASLIYGFGRISRGLLKDSIAGSGILLIILTFVSALFILPFKQILISLAIWFLILMPISGFVMAYLESKLFPNQLIHEHIK